MSGQVEKISFSFDFNLRFRCCASENCDWKKLKFCVLCVRASFRWPGLVDVIRFEKKRILSIYYLLRFWTRKIKFQAWISLFALKFFFSHPLKFRLKKIFKSMSNYVDFYHWLKRPALSLSRFFPPTLNFNSHISSFGISFSTLWGNRDNRVALFSIHSFVTHDLYSHAMAIV